MSLTMSSGPSATFPSAKYLSNARTSPLIISRILTSLPAALTGCDSHEKGVLALQITSNSTIFWQVTCEESLISMRKGFLQVSSFLEKSSKLTSLPRLAWKFKYFLVYIMKNGSSVHLRGEVVDNLLLPLVKVKHQRELVKLNKLSNLSSNWIAIRHQSWVARITNTGHLSFGWHWYPLS